MYSKVKNYQDLSNTYLIFPYNFFLNKAFKTNLISKQKFSYFYGLTHLKLFKKVFRNLSRQFKITKISNTFHKNVFYAIMLESRLITVLYRTFFVLNFKQAKQIILNNAVLINGKVAKNSFRLIKTGDLISFKKSCYTILETNIKKNFKFEFLPANLEISYRTFQILCIAPLQNVLYLNNFNLLDLFKLEYSFNCLFRFLKKK